MTKRNGLKDDKGRKAAPLRWKLSRLVELFLGDNNPVRVVKIKLPLENLSDQ